MNVDFYKALWYPIPSNAHVFSYEPNYKGVKSNKAWASTTLSHWFSRDKKNSHMDAYLSKIEKYGRLYKNIPWVRAIYLCNSITFNALHENSDIDLFIITKKGQLWRARFWSVLLFTLCNLKRNMTNPKQKFCLSFYISEDNLDIEHLRLKWWDVYLPYWIAHLSELYIENQNISNKFQQANIRVKNFLPNISLQQNIFLWHKKFTKKGAWKQFIEKRTPNRFISKSETLIKTIRKPIIKMKISKNKQNIKNIISNNTMLKFHKDKRRQYYFLFKKQLESQR